MTLALTRPQPADTDPELARLAALPVRRRVQWGRWLAVAVAVVLVAQLATSLVTNPRYDWPTFGAYLFSPTILEALWFTVQLTVIGAVVGFLLGGVLALARLSGNRVLAAFSFGFIWLFRSVPLIVQILFWGYLGALYPTIGLGVPFGPTFVDAPTKDLLSPYTAAVIGIVLHQAAYGSEIVRAGILGVSSGQHDAARALGIPPAAHLLRITLPQALRTIVPPAANEVIGLLKGTTAVFILALPDLFYQVQVIYGRNGRIIPLLLVAVAWYAALTTVLSIGQHYLEKRLARGYGATTSAPSTTKETA
ncbi:amino acid ABC transporter permease [Tsukamurella tyrosinosolvens]|uniref:amino acid ABC transporter permease n=1 Tax=Tsukamurella tyrosinosolvens TaxID=57704 RepID=UPI000DF6789F|nr:amino acid ABC transporter permease [Tsukamurella tyrosinosolvens]MEC4614326.1 amino acid ABC transporter permease [Tsukamurella tyrosinosolvens]RDB49341.1 amino acid ABC transporter permease [Tsukamurella tyrosinosolvens]